MIRYSLILTDYKYNYKPKQSQKKTKIMQDFNNTASHLLEGRWGQAREQIVQESESALEHPECAVFTVREGLSTT